MRDPDADLLLVLNCYGYAIPACHASDYAGGTSQIIELRGRLPMANRGLQTTTLVQAPSTTTEIETRIINSVYTQVRIEHSQILQRLEVC